MIGPRVDTEQGLPHIPTLDEFHQMQHLTGPAQQRAITDPSQAKAKVPALSRIPTLDEFRQMRSMTGSGIKAMQVPALPQIKNDWGDKMQIAPRDQLRRGSDRVAGKTASEWARDSRGAAGVVENLLAPLVDHPWMSAGAIGAAMIPVVGPYVSFAMAGDIVSNSALYGFQKHLETQATPEARKIMEADPERISGEAAIAQGIMLGMIAAHAGGKLLKAGDVSAGVMEAGARGVKEYGGASPHGPRTGMSGEFASSLEAGVASADAYAKAGNQPVRPKGLVTHTESSRAGAGAKPVEGLVAPENPKAGRVKPLDTLPANASLAERAAWNEARRTYEADRLAQDEADLSASRSAAAEKVAKADAMRPRRRAAALLQTEQGAETLGTAAAQHGLPADASPYIPDTPQDIAWKAGHESVTSDAPPEGFTPTAEPAPEYPEGFSMGGESRIPAASELPKPARGRDASMAEVSTDADALANMAETGFAGGGGGANVSIPRGQRFATDLSPENTVAVVKAAVQKMGAQEFRAAVTAEIEKRGVKGDLDAEKAVVEQIARNSVGEKLGTQDSGEPAPVTDPVAAEPGLAPVAGTGETKTRGLSLGVEGKAVANKLATGLGDLPEYRTVNMAEQAALAGDLLASDPALARRVALGEVSAPDNLLPESVFVAVENKAIADGDVATIHDLASGKLTEQATTMGQRIRALGERDPDSPVSAIQRIEQNRGGTPNIAKASAREVRSIEAHLEKMDVAWKSFIDGMRC